MAKPQKIAVIGAGAAGYFAAIQAAAAEGSSVIIFEKTAKVLTKVLVSGGGRCNVTHACEHASQLIKNYPRGGKSLKKGFGRFAVQQTIEWFESRGVQLKTEDDGRMFPVTDSSATIANLLQKEAQNRGVQLQLRSEVKAIHSREGAYLLHFKDDSKQVYDKVIVTTGGSNKEAAYQWLRDLNLKIIKPIPSLFTFNVPDSDLKDLQGLSVKLGSVQVPGTKWQQNGPVLITHWGFSAPAVIKLSAWQAVEFFERSYQFPILINWTPLDESQVREELQQFQQNNPKKQVNSHQLFDLPGRLWQRLCEKAGIHPQQRYADLPKKQLNRLIEFLVRSPFQVNGKTTFKEEFVTCGGVDLAEVDRQTFESKKHPGLYLAGEVLNVDGVTGGFNFQHAWTSGYLAGRAAAHG